jgi:hypothetical protein
VGQQSRSSPRLRSMWKAATAALVLLLGLAGCGSDHRSVPRSLPPSARAATPTTDPLGPPPDIAWWSRGELHVGEGVIPLQMGQVVARGGTTIIGRATSHGSTWRILRGHRLVDLFSTRSQGARPVLSANGRFAAWATSVRTHRYNLYEADTRFTITAYDVGHSRATGVTDIDSHTFCCDGGGVVDVVGVDADGSVVLARDLDRAWVWRPGSRPVRLTGDVHVRGVPGNDPWPGGVSWTVGGSSDDPAAYGHVSAHGVVTRTGRVPQSQDGLWSPDGSSYAYLPVTKFGQRMPRVWSDGTEVRLKLRRAAEVVGWESSHELILLTAGKRGRPTLRPAVLARCDVRTGDCEQAGPPVPHARLAVSRLL